MSSESMLQIHSLLLKLAAFNLGIYNQLLLNNLQVISQKYGRNL